MNESKRKNIPRTIIYILAALSLFFIIMVSITCCDLYCDPDNKELVPSSRREFKVASPAGGVLTYRTDRIIYQGHQYLIFATGNGDCARMGVVHDPDCPCHNKSIEHED